MAVGFDSTCPNVTIVGSFVNGKCTEGGAASPDEKRRMNCLRNTLLASFCFASFALVCPSASAQNLVVNAGFEDGSTGWTTSSLDSAVGIAFDGTPYTGTKALRVFSNAGYFGIENAAFTSLAFEPNELYTVGFYARYRDTTPGVGNFIVIAGPSGSSLGNAVHGIELLNDGLYHFYQLTTNPSAGSNRYFFSFRYLPSSNTIINLDDISIVKTSSITAAPEPTTGALLGVVVLVGGMVRHKTSKSKTK